MVPVMDKCWLVAGLYCLLLKNIGLKIHLVNGQMVSENGWESLVFRLLLQNREQYIPFISIRSQTT